MPDDVAEMIAELRYHEYPRAADMLERLSRENSQLREACGNNQQSIVKVRNHYQQRIAELKDEMRKIAASKTWLECIDISHTTLKVVD